MNILSQPSDIKSLRKSPGDFLESAMLAVFYSLLILAVGLVIGPVFCFFRERKHSCGTWL